MTIKVTAGAVLLLVVLLLMCSGCAPIDSGVARGGGTVANPGAYAKLNMATGSVEFASNRDDDGGVEDLEITVPKDIRSPVAGATIKAKKIEFKANASDVRDANSGQIVGMGTFNEATGRAWSGVIDSVGTAASTIVGQVLPNTGAWAFKAVFMMIGIPVAAVFAVVVGVCGLLAIVVVLMLGGSLIKRIRNK